MVCWRGGHDWAPGAVRWTCLRCLRCWRCWRSGKRWCRCWRWPAEPTPGCCWKKLRGHFQSAGRRKWCNSLFLSFFFFLFPPPLFLTAALFLSFCSSFLFLSFCSSFFFFFFPSRRRSCLTGCRRASLAAKGARCTMCTPPTSWQPIRRLPLFVQSMICPSQYPITAVRVQTLDCLGGPCI